MYLREGPFGMELVGIEVRTGRETLIAHNI